MHSFLIRCEPADFLRISVYGRAHDSSDYWDGNWLSASVEIAAGGFRGMVGGDLRAEELAIFCDQFAQIQESLRGSAQFETMEGWLSIRVEGDGRGHMKFSCLIRDKPGTGNRLNCVLETDQTFTRSAIDELKEMVQAFPVIGRP
jgi:hypothetical protein